MSAVLVTFAVRCLLIALFLPFSALDKVLNFKGAVAQASRATSSRMLAGTLVAGGFCIELIMSLAVLSGVADRLAALVLAAYCLITALLWKQFWRRPDFRLKGKSEGREVLWDFREIDGRRGHRSGTVGDGPAALMIIQSEDAAAPSRPCEFR